MRVCFVLAIAVLAAFTAELVAGKTLSGEEVCDDKSWFAAVRSGDTFTVEACLKDKPELGNHQDQLGCTAIVNAAANGHRDIVIALASAAPDAVDVNHQCRSGRTALHHAALRDSIPIARALRNKNASIDIADKDGETALTLAAQHASIRVLAYLNSLTIDIFDSWTGSELLWAAAHHNVDHVKVALSRDGSHIEDRDAHGQTALLWAARTGSVAMLNELLSHGANMDVVSECGWSPLHFAAYFRHQKMTEELLKHQVDLHKKDKTGWSPMMWAAAGGDVNIISFLHAAGASIQIQEKHGWTPLMMAAARGKDAAVNYLLRHGADWRAKNDLGMMAWEVAKVKGHDDIYKQLHHVYQVAEGKHEEL